MDYKSQLDIMCWAAEAGQLNVIIKIYEQYFINTRRTDLISIFSQVMDRANVHDEHRITKWILKKMKTIQK